jgi:23S rRNA (uracil1939-C5)-methyltransferase
MTLRTGEQLELAVEKPAAGGRMIARHEGRIILVQGGIPGERIVARVDKVERQLAFAQSIEILEPSPDRRQTHSDPSCGGCLYAHIAYPRQLQLKGEVIRDAFTRLGRLPVDAPVVQPSPESGYRMRARLHVRGGHVGFYREGSHDLCDAAATSQLTPESVEAAARSVAAIVAAGCPLSGVELAENVSADERVLHLIPAEGGELTERMLDDALAAGGLTGCTGQSGAGALTTAGIPVVSDPLAVLTAGMAGSGTLRRHASSFFQANRFLLPTLVTGVIAAVPQDGAVLDLYAGVGLFSMALASVGRGNITAIEGDRTSGSDLLRNAAPYAAAVRAHVESVEQYLKRRTEPAATIVVDPPRTGMSRDAMQSIVTAGAAMVVYVSCDPPTMARDARRLVDGGYALASLTAFDLFPNTPHVESLAVFSR